MKKLLLILLALCGNAFAQTAQSPDNTVVTTAGPTITDASGNVWAITSGGQVTENGSVISYTSGVTQIALVGGTVWQFNGGASGPQRSSWYSFAPNGDLAIGATATSPLPSTSAIEAQQAPSSSTTAAASPSSTATSSAATPPDASSPPANTSASPTPTPTGFSAIPVSQPTPFPGNAIVNVSSDGSNWPGTLSNNTTYNLPSGTFNGTSVSNTGTNIQVFGNGPGNTILSGPITNGQAAGQGVNGLQVVGLDIDCTNSPNNAFAVEGSNMLLQNCHIKNYHGAGSNSEVFIVQIWSCGDYATTNNTVDHCQFTPASSGSNGGGISCFGACAYSPDGGTWDNQSITNCIFDTPTDTGIAYYHCVPPVSTITGNTYTANAGIGGQFLYCEPGSEGGVPSHPGQLQDDSNHTTTVSGNTVNMNGNQFWLVQFNTSGNPTNDGILGSFVITNNTISNAPYVCQIYNDPNGANGGFPPQTPGIQGITIMNNTITNGGVFNISGNPPSGFIGSLVTSPNP